MMLHPTVKHRRQHRFFRISGSTHDVVQPDHHVRNGASEQNNLHEVACVGQRGIACAEKVKNVVQENKRYSAIKHRVK